MTFDTIIIGGGHSGLRQGVSLLKEGQRCLIISAGESSRPFRDPDWSQEIERHYFEDLGGVWLDDRVLSGVFESDNEGDLLLYVLTEKGGAKALSAEQFILATGSFYVGGLAADPLHVWEPVFGLDVFAEGAHKDWVNPDFFAPQPFMEFGVRVDAQHRALRNGRPVLNLLAFGSVVCARDAR